MILWREGRVAALGTSLGCGAVEYGVAWSVEVDVRAGGRCRALAYPALVGVPEVGDRVLLNTGGPRARSRHRRLRPRRRPARPVARRRRLQGPGHLVKARYTPLQAMVLGVDEQESEHHERARRGRRPARDAGRRRRPAQRRCRPSWPASVQSAPSGAGRVRDDRRRSAAGVVLPHGRGAARTPAGSRRASPPGRPSAATWRRSPCTRPARGARTCWTRTSRS